MRFKFECVGLPSAGVFAIFATLLSATVASSQRVTPPPASTASGDLSSMDLEQLMKIEVVFAGSKRAQQTRDVPSFVSVVTAAQIKEHGYRTLADVLKTLPDFYISNDRNYSFTGVRGFDRPGDYNSRVLLLLNGLRTNDNMYDQAHIGEDFIVDMDLVDHIEVIRGPSAAIYGNNALFAVINVVTKQGQSLQGPEVAATAASFGTYAGRASYGKTFDNSLDLLVSASVSDSKGQRLYFPEFDRPSTNNGVADHADYERFSKLLATATKGGFSLQASNVWREQGIPTGSFGTLFNDPRTQSIDGLTLASLSYTRSLSDSASFSARVHGGRSTYWGTFASAAGESPDKDDGIGEWWGADLDARRRIARHFVTVGAEYQDDFRQTDDNHNAEPYILYYSMSKHSDRYGVFAQDEITLFAPLLLYAGARYDRYETFGSALSPRVGLIYTPSGQTTLKVLAGRAFRAPNVYEMFADNLTFKPNLQLQPERIETLELVAQQMIGGGVQLSASTFHNKLTSLLTQRIDSTDKRLVFENSGEIASKGLEFGLGVNRGHGPSGELTYTLQRTENRATRIELTNSPRQMAKLQLRAPLGVHDATLGLDAQWMSDRATLAGNTDPGSVVTNLSLLAPRVFGRFELSATVYNVFGVAYGAPGSVEHVQDIIQQDGRSFRVKTALRF
ncbi:MAG: TonB-dependent receptor [bacterium]